MQACKPTLRYIVCEPADVGLRADVVAGRRIPLLTRRVARKMALDGGLYIDHVRSPPSTRVQLGMVLEFQWAQTGDNDPAELVILQQTSDYIYIDKPPGMHTCRISPSSPQTLGDLVIARFPECASASPTLQDQGAVHRLDAMTSGVTVFARNRMAWQRARLGFSQRTISKYYLALSTNPQNLSWPPPLPLHGHPNWLTESTIDFRNHYFDIVHQLHPSNKIKDTILSAMDIRAPLGRGKQVQLVSVRADGQPCFSSIQPILQIKNRSPNLFLSLVQLHTGFRHQVRAHLAWIHLPILGDLSYQQVDSSSLPMHPPVYSRIYLHSWKIDLSSVNPLESAITARIPKDFITRITNL